MPKTGAVYAMGHAFKLPGLLLTGGLCEPVHLLLMTYIVYIPNVNNYCIFIGHFVKISTLPMRVLIFEKDESP